MVVPLPSDGDKVFEPQDVLVDKTLIPSDEIIAREGGVINVAPASWLRVMGYSHAAGEG
jgi:hypothetical protein